MLKKKNKAVMEGKQKGGKNRGREKRNEIEGKRSIYMRMFQMFQKVKYGLPAKI